MEGREQDEFLNLFYEEFVHKLAMPVAGKVSPAMAPLNGSLAEDAQPPTDEGDMDVLGARQHVCELLCFCVTKHTYRIKYFILRNNVLNKCLKLARKRDKWLLLGALPPLSPLYLPPLPRASFPSTTDHRGELASHPGRSPFST